ncbi:hypothetical protein CK203_079175 [Vitis vinifera]|uniref:Reverse transcriptase zinc-binding domain-containing protein n=1 Tax=Vitis vinifera TaxID=29760 RepID=A0A438DYU5_VITVI|nr:hypothetical protein CK203_079175 [Vitis vinifera]
MKMSLKLKKMKNMRRFMVRDLCGSAPIGGGQGGKKALQIRISFSIPWKLCKTGKMGMLGCSIRSYYDSLNLGDAFTIPSKLIWNLKTPSKVGFFVWEATSRKFLPWIIS